MISKQKIKRLEKSADNLRGQKIHICFKKSENEEIYSSGGKLYYSEDSIKKDMGFQKGDILVAIMSYMGFSEYFK